MNERRRNVAYNETEITRALAYLMPEGLTIELRALAVNRQGNTAGYFNERACLVEAASDLSSRAEGVYVTLNPVDEELLARANNRVRPFARTTTTDDEITQRRWLFVDVDSVRPRGVSATEDEVKNASRRASAIRRWLREQGWPDPVAAMSGNGVHLLYRVAQGNTPEARDLQRDILRLLHDRFSDREAEVDRATFNASRIIRLYGTLACKGDHLDDRPHRIARILDGPVRPSEVQVVTDDQMRDLTRRFAQEPTPAGPEPTSANVSALRAGRERGLDLSGLDVVAWFRAHEMYGQLMDEDRGQHTVRCPWEEEHSGGDGAYDSDTTIWDGRDGRLPGFRCLHQHCTGRRIREVVNEWGDAEQFGARARLGRAYDLTDEGNALRLIDRSGGVLRFVPDLGGWMCWREELGRWMRDQNEVEVTELARMATRAILQEAEAVGDGERRTALLRWEQQSQKFERRRAQVGASGRSREVRAHSADFDTDRLKINCTNGVADLTDGRLLAPSPDQMFTLQAPHSYNSGALCPRWDQFLLEIMDGNEELVHFLWRALGYSVTGDTSEQVLFFLHGGGSNGKSTFLDVIQHTLGDYATMAAPGLLMERKSDKHPTGVADLRGRRFVACEEVSEGGRLAEDLVKQLTGTEKLKARLMRQDYFVFEATHKLWLAANHKPTVRGADHAIWRRILLVPFEVQFGKDRQEPGLLSRLQGEAPGILARMVSEACEWKRTRLPLPEVVCAAVEEYREEQDWLGMFLDDCCATGADEWDTACNLYQGYREWCERTGERSITQRAFGLALRERGFTSRKVSVVRWIGLRRLSDGELLERVATE